jgi:hypothetical protein
MILVASIEDEVAVVLPTQSASGLVLWRKVYAGGAPTPVLHDDGVQLGAWISDVKSRVVYFCSHLLVGFVDAYVRVCGYGHACLYEWFHYHEASRENSVAVVLVVNRQTIVAAHFDAAILVGDRKAIVGVEGEGGFRCFR